VNGLDTAVILAGGLGTRMGDSTNSGPKPMQNIGAKPIIWHLIQYFSFYGIRNFIICAGYKSDVIKDYFAKYQTNNQDFTIKIASESTTLTFYNVKNVMPLSITVIDTGEVTPTGGRLKQVAEMIPNQKDFLCTYGDGLSDVNIHLLYNSFRTNNKLAQVCAYKPNIQFGILDIDESGQVKKFEEKPKLDSWINAGFFIFKSQVFDHLKVDSVLETDILVNLATTGQLNAYKHDGFWQSMDTLKERSYLNSLWLENRAPWKVW